MVSLHNFQAVQLSLPPPAFAKIYTASSKFTQPRQGALWKLLGVPAGQGRDLFRSLVLRLCACFLQEHGLGVLELIYMDTSVDQINKKL